MKSYLNLWQRSATLLILAISVGGLVATSGASSDAPFHPTQSALLHLTGQYGPSRAAESSAKF